MPLDESSLERDRDEGFTMPITPLALYVEARQAMLDETNRLFPPGCRVQPVGTTTGNWGATVRDLDEHGRRKLSADMVWLDWDNGNKFPVCISEIERAAGGSRG